VKLSTTVNLQFGGPGSGCRGPNCGRPKTLYHGTTQKVLASILKNGLEPTKSHEKYYRKVWVSSDYKTASDYAKQSASRGFPGIILHIRNAKELGFEYVPGTKGKTAGTGSFVRNAAVPASYITKVEVIDHHGQVVQTLHKGDLSGASGDVYMVLTAK
jgi:RNA:NAD 2'-phosphotransferase (TPT1/KptA family)